jgi:UDPglucose 6-dehydrogenase
MGAGGQVMRICVQGLWHLGTVSAACMASLGHQVTGLDFDSNTIEKLAGGSPPLFEPGLEELLKQGIASGRLRFSASPEEAVRDIELLWIAYDTPVDEDDRADVEHVVAQIEKTLVHLPQGATVLVSSQMPVGSVRRLESIAGRQCPGKGISFACSPENLRLGKAIEVFLKPDRIVVGLRSERDRARLASLMQSITERIEWMSVESAEMTKHAINAFLATSVVFSNEIASICEGVDADAKEVERGLKSDSRIGAKAYLSPGSAFAGGTLARDIAFLDTLGKTTGLQTPLLASVKPSNDAHRKWVQHKLQQVFPDLSRSKIAIWGLAYKPGTDTLRRSLSIELCRWLVGQGAETCVHDPAVRQLPSDLKSRVTQAEDPLAALNGAHALVVSTEWPEYKKISPDVVSAAAPGIVVLDPNRFLSAFATDRRLRYMAVGTPG